MKETLEGVLEKYSSHKDDANDRVFYETGVKEILKWQQERMYSEEELKSILKSFIEDTRGDKPWVDADDEWFEKIKNK